MMHVTCKYSNILESLYSRKVYAKVHELQFSKIIVNKQSGDHYFKNANYIYIIIFVENIIYYVYSKQFFF